MSARSSPARVLASTLSVFTFASAMSLVLDGLERATSNPCSSSLSWIWYPEVPRGLDHGLHLVSEGGELTGELLYLLRGRSGSGSRLEAYRPHLGSRPGTSFYGRLFQRTSRVSPLGWPAGGTLLSGLSADQSGSRSGLAQSGFRVSRGPSARRA